MVSPFVTSDSLVGARGACRGWGRGRTGRPQEGWRGGERKHHGSFLSRGRCHRSQVHSGRNAGRVGKAPLPGSAAAGSGGRPPLLGPPLARVRPPGRCRFSLGRRAEAPAEGTPQVAGTFPQLVRRVMALAILLIKFDGTRQASDT